MYDIVTRVFCVEFQEAVGIGPHPFRDSPLHREQFVVVECCVAVVGRQWNGDDERNNRYQKETHESVFHKTSVSGCEPYHI
jgi:hypothetical protein